jgi:hypothetical protein
MFKTIHEAKPDEISRQIQKAPDVAVMLDLYLDNFAVSRSVEEYS